MSKKTTSDGHASLTLGTMYFGTAVPESVSMGILDAAYERGVRAWDTANNYAFWVPSGTGDESERCLGRWLAAHPSRRDDIFLSTKVGARPAPGGSGLADALGLSAAAIREQVVSSLRRLGTDHVDLLYAHVDDRTVPLAETMGALEELCAEGLVREIGASNLTATRLREAVEIAASGRGGYRCLQQRFTFLRPKADADLAPHVLLDEEVAAECTAAGIAMLGYSPLLSGAYTRTDRPLPSAYDTRANRDALAVLARVAAEEHLDSGQTVVAWMAQRDEPVHPVVGVSSTAQLLAAADAAEALLTAEALFALDTARMGA